MWTTELATKTNTADSSIGNHNADRLVIAGLLSRRSPLVAQFAQLQEHGAWIGSIRQVRKRLAQLRDHRRAGQAQECVDLRFDLECRDIGVVRVLGRELLEHLRRTSVVRLAIEREAQVVL